MVHFARLALILSCALCALPSTQGSCQTPITPEEAFSCTSSDVSFFQSRVPEQWWLPGTSPPTNYVPGISFIKDYYSCCRFCVWSFEFPASAPVVALHGPTLDCMEFKADFTLFDQDNSNDLNQTEMLSYTSMPPNDYLVENKLLNASSVFLQTDLDRSGKISLEEFMVLRHFWAVVHTIKTGPLRAAEDGKSLSVGSLAGLFLDAGQIQAWFTVANSINLEKYMDYGWDTSLTREPLKEELAETVLKFDLDGSTRVSIEEHYFKVFADRNGDGIISKDEYYMSLYKKTNPAGKPDNPFLFPISFILHDWNGDGKVTFLERKFVAADVNQDAELTREEWIAGDFPANFGPFDGHAVSSAVGKPPTINTVRYFFYTVFHECASQGIKEYRSSVLDSPWSRSCLVDVLIQHYPPFVNAVENKTSECGKSFCNVKNGTLEKLGNICESDHDCANDRGCSYFGFCHLQSRLEPEGEHPRMRRWIVQPTGYSVSIMKETMTRLRYNYTMTLMPSLRLDSAQAPVPLQGKVKVWRPKMTFVLTSNFEQLRYASTPSGTSDDKPGLTSKDVVDTLNQYQCTNSLWPNDGFVVVVRTKPDVLSNQMGMWYMLGSASFINFVAVFFFFVLVMGHFFWFFEHKHNEDHFRSFYAEGVMDGLWFAMVTVTTVGYGDKTCLTCLGRLFGAFWMLFGLICFGLFGGQVVGELGKLQSAADIQDVAGIAGMNVGVLETAFPAELSTIYGFAGVNFGTVKDAAEALQQRRINAILMPHSNVLNYFTTEKQYMATCGNPLKIVGEPLLQDKLQFGLQNALCACDKCNNPQPGTSVFASQYLAEAMNTKLKELAAEDFLAGQIDEHLIPAEQADPCDPGHGFEIYSIIAMFVTATNYFILLFFINHRSTRPTALALYSGIQNFFLERAYQIGFMHRSWRFVNKDEAEEIDDEFDNLQEVSRSEHIEKYVDKLQTLCLGHNADVRKLQVEVMEGRKTMSKIIRFFTAAGAVVLCVICLVYTTLVIVWGSEIRLTELGASPNAKIYTKLDL